MKKRTYGWRFVLLLVIAFGFALVHQPKEAYAEDSTVKVWYVDGETKKGEKEYSSLSAAWNAIATEYKDKESVYIQLNADQEISGLLSTKAFKFHVTLDLNGYLLYGKEDVYNRIYVNQEEKYHDDKDDNDKYYKFTITSSKEGAPKSFEKKNQEGWQLDKDSTDFTTNRGVIYGVAIVVANARPCEISKIAFVGKNTGVSVIGGFLDLNDVWFYGCSSNGGVYGSRAMGALVVCYCKDDVFIRVLCTVRNCDFQYNYSPTQGGAICAGALIAIDNTTIQNNRAAWGGGIFVGYKMQGCNGGGEVDEEDELAEIVQAQMEKYENGGGFEEKPVYAVEEFVYDRSIYSVDAALWEDSDATKENKIVKILTNSGVASTLDKLFTGIVVFDNVTITDNYDRYYANAKGEWGSSNVCLYDLLPIKIQKYADFASDKESHFKYRSLLLISDYVDNSKKNIKIGIRKGGDSNVAVIAQRRDEDGEGAIERNGYFAEEGLIFPDDNEANAQNYSIERVGWSNHWSYKIVSDPILKDANGVKYDSVEEAISLNINKWSSLSFKAIKASSLDYLRMAGKQLAFDLNGNNLTVTNGLAEEANSGSIKITNSGSGETITYVLDTDSDGIYDTVSASGDSALRVYGPAVVGANEKCGIVSGTSSDTDVCYTKGIYSFATYFKDYCTANGYTDLSEVKLEEYKCENKTQFTVQLPTDRLSYNGTVVYHFGNVKNDDANSFTVGAIAADGSVTITSASAWTGRQSFTVDVISDVVNFETYTITVFVNSGDCGPDENHDGKCDLCQTKIAFSVTATSRVLGADATVTAVTVDAAYGLAKKGAVVTVATKEILGYTFKGWYSAADIDPATKKLVDSATAQSTGLFYVIAVNDDVELVAVYEAIGKVKVSLYGNGFTVTSENGVLSAVQEACYEVGLSLGSTVTVRVTEESFIGWTNEYGKIVSTAQEFTFTVTGAVKYTMSKKGTAGSTALVEFVSNYGQVVQSQTYGTESVISMPAGPSRMGYTFTGWAFTAEEIRTKIANGETYIKVLPVYEQDTQKTYSVTVFVDDVEDAEQKVTGVLPGTTKRVNAPTVDGKVFLYWTDATGKVLSYNTSYFMQVSKNITVKAVYGAAVVAAKPVIAMTNIFATVTGGKNKISFSATRDISAGYTLVEHGMLYNKLGTIASPNESTFVLGGTGVSKYVSTDASKSGVFTLNVNMTGALATKVVARGYMIVVNDSGEREVYYTDLSNFSYNEVNSN